MNVDKFYTTSVNGQLFFDYLALELNYTNDYNFSDYYNIITILNKDKNIKKFNNFNSSNRLLDLINDFYNNNMFINLCYNSQDLLVSVNDGELYYNIYINIRHKLFKNYKNMLYFVGELVDYIETTSNT